MKRVLYVAITLLLVLTMPGSARANYDKDFYDSNDIMFYHPEELLSQGCTTNLSGPLPGEDNLQKIYNFFLSKGASKKVSAAMVGNIAQESNGDPLIRQGGSRTDKPELVGINKGPYKNGRTFTNSPGDVSVGDAWGILQWDPGHAALYWQKQAGVGGDITKLETQLEVTWWHLNNLSPTSRKNMLAEAEKKSTLEETTKYLVGFWGPSSPHEKNRVNAAVKAMSYPVDPSIVLSNPSDPAGDTCHTDIGPLGEGGLTREQAIIFAQNYGANKNDSTKKILTPGNYWCGGGSTCYKGSNCVSFTAFFLRKFTSTEYAGGNGSHSVRNLGARGVPTGNTPRVGAIFSWSNSTYGHTGVVLGIHGDTLVVGHSSWSARHTANGAGDGLTYGKGAAFIRVGKANSTHTWMGKVPTEFAYPENIDFEAIEQYLTTGE